MISWTGSLLAPLGWDETKLTAIQVGSKWSFFIQILFLWHHENPTISTSLNNRTAPWFSTKIHLHWRLKRWPFSKPFLKPRLWAKGGNFGSPMYHRTSRERWRWGIQAPRLWKVCGQGELWCHGHLVAQVSAAGSRERKVAVVKIYWWEIYE